MLNNVHLPTAATGNSRSLVTLGASGEIMGFFYPHLDFAQNIREAMPALFLHGVTPTPMLWSFVDCLERSQEFKPRTNIVVTELRHRQFDLRLELTDLLPPDEKALIRRIVVTRGPGTPPVTFMHYFKLAVADVTDRNAVYFFPDQKAVVQHFRETCLATAIDGPFTFQLGSVVPGETSQVKLAMERNCLESSWQVMGNVDFALALENDEQEHFEATLVLAGGEHVHEAADNARRLADIPFKIHERLAADRCGSILKKAVPCQEPGLSQAYDKAILAIHDLYDQEHSAHIAAPEFDPGYGYSGGYGYCWPRDSAVISLTAARLGFVSQAEDFFDWTIRTQLKDGHWFQRYWVEGSEAPSWCVQDNELQLDQTCAILHGAALLADLLGDRRAAFIDRYRPTACRAAKAIIRHVGEDGLHRPSADLWECCHGSFAYTQAAVAAALGDGARIFDAPTVDIALLRRALFERLWDADRRCWNRRIDPNGQLDSTRDSSCLGVIEPWGLLDLTNATDLAFAQQTVDDVCQNLAVPVKGGQAILRFEGESYMGGGPGCVNTLWAALCLLRLAGASDAQQRGQQIERARTLMDVALANTNPTGQLPELIPNIHFDYWAAPHGWASALLIECVLELNSLSDQ